MKKTSIISIAIVFIVSIILVGFLGRRIDVDEPIYPVTSIEWVYSDLEKKGYKIKEYNEEEKKIKGVNAELTIEMKKEDKQLIIPILCNCYPTHATNRNLAFYKDDTISGVNINKIADTSANVIVTEKTSFTLTIKSTGEGVIPVSYLIKFNVTEPIEDTEWL